MFVVPQSGSATPGGPEGPCSPLFPPLFFVAKRKKRDKSKKERFSKQKLLKGCHQGQNIIVLAIPERLEFENFSCRTTMVADNIFQCFMTPQLWNRFRRPCQCIINQDDFQHKTLNCQPSSSFCPYIQVGQERGGRNYENCL